MNEAISDVGRLVNRNTKAIRVSSLLLRRFSAFQANILTTNLRVFWMLQYQAKAGITYRTVNSKLPFFFTII